jgi:hypothetical protein
MTTKDLLKSEIEKVPDEYIDALYKIVKALERRESKSVDEGWSDFINQTYGCMGDNPISRGEQGVFDIRGEIR